MTNLLLEHFVPRFRLLLAALLLALAACGPGSGGTGTGPIASFSSVSSTGAVTGSPSGSDGGVAPGVCVGTCGRVDLLLQVDRVELVGDCGRFVFSGLWEADASGQAVLPGTLEIPSGGSGAPATLRLQFSGAPESSQTVTVSLSAANEQTVVLGPELLGRAGEVPSRTPVGACPS